MDCCQCQGIETKFDRKYVAKKLKQYREDGPAKTTLQLIEALQAEGVKGMELLDIGGGLGDILHALLASGASKATNVEASSAYIKACTEEAERQGNASKINHVRGNFVDLAEDIPSADIVTLDRVICCYHDMPRLVKRSVQKAKRLYGVVYPRDTWWVKLGSLLYYNLRNWIQRNPMRYYVHPTEAVEDVIRGEGMERTYYREMGPWQVVVFSRS
jgi:magnesium-protoporphyrin O-methyltransferase